MHSRWLPKLGRLQFPCLASKSSWICAPSSSPCLHTEAEGVSLFCPEALIGMVPFSDPAPKSFLLPFLSALPCSLSLPAWLPGVLLSLFGHLPSLRWGVVSVLWEGPERAERALRARWAQPRPRYALTCCSLEESSQSHARAACWWGHWESRLAAILAKRRTRPGLLACGSGLKGQGQKGDFSQDQALPLIWTNQIALTLRAPTAGIGMGHIKAEDKMLCSYISLEGFGTEEKLDLCSLRK